MSARTSSVMNNKMYSTVFNRECKVENYNIFETAYDQQFHTYTNTIKQCGWVDEQVGIAMTLLANCCWDRPKQRQNMFAEVRDQGMLDKAT